MTEKSPQVSLSEDREYLQLIWPTGPPDKYPSVWLRDNCQCQKCFGITSTARSLLVKNLDPDVKITQAQVTGGGDIEVCWSDGHSGVFTGAWLRPRSFSPEAQAARETWYDVPSKLWAAADMQGNIPTCSFQQLMTSDKTLYDWLVSMESTGLFLVTDAPRTQGVIKQIGDRVAYLNPTNYGLTFQVKAKLEPSNLAYTGLELGLHTDLPYYQYTAGMQMLHCIKQVPTEGGSNEFVDSFYVAKEMKKLYPDDYCLLTTLPLDYKDIGADQGLSYYLLTRQYTIDTNKKGEVVKVTWNNMTRDSYMASVPLEKVKDMYRAMRRFHDLCYDPKYMINIKLKEGDVVCFHNFRVLHGRQGYQVLTGGDRHLEGGYINWDELASRRRVLRKKLDL